MEMYLPVSILLVAIYFVVHYARAVMYRRTIILPQVTRFIDDESIPVQAKFMVYHAFQDALDYGLALKIYKVQVKAVEKNEKGTQQAENLFVQLDERTKKELLSIVDECIKLNIRFAWPVHHHVKGKFAALAHDKKSTRAVARNQVKRALITYADKEFHAQIHC